MNKPEVIETKYSVRDGGHYVPGIKYNGVLYISGQLSIDPEIGKVPEGGVKAEAAQALKNLHTVLKEAGLIRDEREGKFIYYELNTTVLEEIMLWMSELKGE